MGFNKGRGTMIFTVKPTGRNMHWIKKNSEKDIQNSENAALDRWATEDGYIADETKKIRLRKNVFIDRKRRLVHPRHPYRNMFR